MIIVSMALGLLLGLVVSMVPALMLATLLGLMLSSGMKELMGGLNVAVMATTALGASLYARRVGMLLNPVGVNLNSLASLDPALRLAHSGQASVALDLMVQATTRAALPTSLVLVGLTWMNHLVPTTIGQLMKGLGAVVPWAIALWAILLVGRAKRKAETGVALAITGYLGYTVFHSSLSGVENSIVLLMFGMFTLPMAMWTSSSIESLDLEYPLTGVEPKGWGGWMGIPIGAIAGSLPGLGNSSIVSMFEQSIENDRRYVSVATEAETTAEMLGVFLLLATGMSRSGEAVQISQALNGSMISTPAAMLVLVSLFCGMYVGHWMLPLVVRIGLTIQQRTPGMVHILAGLLLGFAQVVVVAQHADIRLTACTVLGSFACAMGIRWCGLPNQVSFGMLSLPVLVMYM